MGPHTARHGHARLRSAVRSTPPYGEAGTRAQRFIAASSCRGSRNMRLNSSGAPRWRQFNRNFRLACRNDNLIGRRFRGARGKRLLRQGGERLERPYAHLYETGRDAFICEVTTTFGHGCW
jgi:hypothetical protein